MWIGSFPCSPFSPNLLHVLPSGMTGLHNLWKPGHSTICHCHCYHLRSIRMWASRDDMESLTSWIFNSWRDRNRSRLTNFSMSRPVVFVLLFEFQNSKLFPSLPEISKQLRRNITKLFFWTRFRSLTGLAFDFCWNLRIQSLKYSEPTKIWYDKVSDVFESWVRFAMTPRRIH